MINSSQKCCISNIFILYTFFMYPANSEIAENNPNLSKSRCYPELGCIVYGADWYDKIYRPVNELPLSRHTINTQFILYSHNKEDPNEPLATEIISAVPATINISSYAPSRTVRILIHDFTSSGFTGWTKHLARALLEKKEKGGNIISVDWEAGAEPPYTQAIGNARLVALEILLFIAMLRSDYGLEHSQLHLIGHGVGAHIAGYVGEALKVEGQATVGKITALDPNGPYFEHMSEVVKLDIHDALFVEVVHTDAHPEGQGIIEPIGHTDYYPNNGYAQPGCNVSHKYPHILKLTRDSIKNGDIYPGCSHKRAFKYYIESIRNPDCNYIGFHCSNYSTFLRGGCTSCDFFTVPQCAQLSLDTAYNETLYRDACSTPYYFRTGSSDTFCLDIYKFIINFSKNVQSQIVVSGYFEVNLTSSEEQVFVNNIILNEFRLYPEIDQSKGNYTFLGWVEPPPTVNEVGTALIKWENLATPLSINKKSPVFINNISVSHLTMKDVIINVLCSERPMNNQLNSGEVEQFHACISARNETTVKPVVNNDSESNIIENNIHVYLI